MTSAAACDRPYEAGLALDSLLEPLNLAYCHSGLAPWKLEHLQQGLAQGIMLSPITTPRNLTIILDALD